MNALVALDTKNLRQMEFLSFSQQVVHLIHEVYEVPTPQMARFIQDVDSLSALMVPVEPSLRPLPLKQMASKVDQCLTNIRKYLNAFVGHYDCEKSQAARGLLLVYANYKQARYEGYSAKMASVGLLIDAFHQVDPDILQAIDFAPWVKHLSELRQNFLQAQKKAVENRSLNRAHEIRERYRALLRTYGWFKNQIDAMATLYESEQLHLLIGRLNVIVEQFRKRLKIRRGLSAHRIAQLKASQCDSGRPFGQEKPADDVPFNEKAPQRAVQPLKSNAKSPPSEDPKTTRPALQTAKAPSTGDHRFDPGCIRPSVTQESPTFRPELKSQTPWRGPSAPPVKPLEQKP